MTTRCPIHSSIIGGLPTVSTVIIAAGPRANNRNGAAVHQNIAFFRALARLLLIEDSIHEDLSCDHCLRNSLGPDRGCPICGTRNAACLAECSRSFRLACPELREDVVRHAVQAAAGPGRLVHQSDPPL